MNCLTCKYEPEWGKVVQGGFGEERTGYCKWNRCKNIPSSFVKTEITVRLDGSGVYQNCKCWVAKIRTVRIKNGSKWYGR